MGVSGEELDMVPMLEIAFLVVCAALGLRWFRRTNLYRAHRRSGVDPGQRGTRSLTGRADQNMSGPR
jgi:hypothetical protein